MTDQMCDQCGAKVKRYWHKITPGLVKTLVKVYQQVCSKEQNLVHKDELNLDHSEYGNFQKLRFHALIAKYKENGVWIRGGWVITRRGAQFLRGAQAIPKKVQTYRNKVVAHDPDLVFVKDVMRSTQYWEDYGDFAMQNNFFSDNDTEKVEIGTPAEIKKKGRRKGKNKVLCIKCGGEMKKVIATEPTQHKTIMKVTVTRQCKNCGNSEKYA